jgi:hypothetical protein
MIKSPVFPPPDPETDFETLLGEMFKESPKFITPLLLLIFTGSVIRWHKHFFLII